jgi:UDP-N-acetylmuramyl pentapeptide synthase
VTSVGEDELDGALAAVRAELDGTAVVLVKGSRALRLDRVVDALRL